MKGIRILSIFVIFSVCVICLSSNIYAIKDPDVIDNSYENYDDDTVSCGYVMREYYRDGKKVEEKSDYLITGFPESIVKVTHLLYLGILIAVPVVLVIFGMLDLFKGLYAQKEDEIKKGQQMLLKRLIAAAIVFFAFLIVKLVIGFASNKGSANRIIQCAECFIDGNCD